VAVQSKAAAKGTVVVKPRTKKRSVALKLTVVARQLRVSFDQAVEQSGLTRAQWMLIATVSRNPGATQRVIAEALEVREITAGRLVDRLVEEGFLERKANPNDRRAYCLHLTDAAQPVLDTLDELAKVHEAAIFAGFEAAEIDQLEKYLDTIGRNLSNFRAERTPAK
jgi:MarR family transcriptional regulator, transcriptional regulator for hemolysin